MSIFFINDIIWIYDIFICNYDDTNSTGDVCGGWREEWRGADSMSGPTEHSSCCGNYLIYLIWYILYN